MRTSVLHLGYIILSFFVAACFSVRSYAQKGTVDYRVILHLRSQKVKKMRVRVPEGTPDVRLRSRAREQALTYLYKDGHFDARIDSILLPSRKKSHKIVIYAHQGQRYHWGLVQVYLDKEQLISGYEMDQLKKENHLYQGEAYEASHLNAFIEAMIGDLSHKGYLFAKGVVDSLDPNPKTGNISAHIRVSAGDQVRVSGVIFAGRRYNDASYLARIAGIRDSSIITDRQLETGRENLQNSDLFTKVGEAGIVKEGDKYYVAYPVVEKNTNSFDLIVGYVPRAGQSNIIVGTGHLSVKNAIWDGSALDLSFQRLQQYVTRFQGGYHQDFLFGQPLGAGFNFRFYQQDSSYQQRSIHISTDYQLNSTTRLSLGVRREVTAVSGQGALVYPVVDASVSLLDFGVQYQNVDYLDNPTRGLQVGFTAETGFKWIGQDTLAGIDRQRIRYQSLHVDAQPYFRVFRRQVVTPSIHAFVLQAGPYYESDLYRFGGAESLRGYAEEQFSASRMLWGDVEWRYLLEARAYGFLFGAAGTYYRPPMHAGLVRTGSIVQRLYSYGLGFSVHTALGQLRFTYAKSANTPIDNGKVHISISGRF
ncbi:MAG TPA: BamA/TamA family outer membrane protein [Balneolales bacterium]|nr:BamA/TamA family outer membrane protein [Balneolales bacterium]